MECIKLMIVVAIIGILAAIAIPAYQNYTKKASEGACMSETKGYANALYAYMSDPNRDAADAPAKNIAACLSIAGDTAVGTAAVESITLIGTPAKGTKTTTCTFSNGATCELTAAAPGGTNGG